MANTYKTKITSGRSPRTNNIFTRTQRTYSRLDMAKKTGAKSNRTPKKGKGISLTITPELKQKLKKVGLLILCLFLLSGFFGGVWAFSYLQQLDAELPPLDDPFRSKDLASILYDRDGKTELYRLFNEVNRDNEEDLSTLPAHVKWAFLAAEDVEYYGHDGFDLFGISRCLVLNAINRRTVCGGSTITQQTVKLTAVGDDRTLERKLKEVLMSMKIEQAYTKDEILQLYLTVVPMGSNLTGLTAGAEFYFGKKTQDLTIAEAAVLVSISNNPYYNSPTLAPNPEKGKENAKNRQLYVLGQLEKHMNYINDQHRRNINDANAADLFTMENLEEAKNIELEYKPPIFATKKAGHFVDYVVEELQNKVFIGEEPLTLSQLQTGGYKIITTLDWGLQEMSENTVKNAVNNQGRAYGAGNAALVTIQPTNGHIMALVGSKNYYGQKEGCDRNKRKCTFDPQVNVLNAPNSPGSATKPFGFFEAYRQGMIYPGSLLPDIPVDIGGGYSIGNWNNSFTGVSPSRTAATVLKESLNIPAVEVVEMITVPRFLQVMREFGFTTYKDDSQYGHSVIIGGADVLGMELAQGYGVFANNGDLVKNTSIIRIEDRNGNIVYEHKPERKKVADSQAVYQLNYSLNNNYSFSWDGRDIANKTGTSENHMDLWTAVYTPDFVTVAWMGNNNNKPMSTRAFGASTIVPWMKSYVRQIGAFEGAFNRKTSFSRPGGIVFGGACGGNCEGEYKGFASAPLIQDRQPPASVIYSKATVCKDQPFNLARQIDKDMGLAEERTFLYYKMPVAKWQPTLDKFMKERQGYPNGAPTQECTIDRSGSGSDVWFTGLTASTPGSSINIKGKALTSGGNITEVSFYLDNTSTLLGTVTTADFNETYPVPGGFESGEYDVIVIAKNNQSKQDTQTKRVTIGSGTNTNMQITVPAAPLVHGVQVGGGNNQSITLNYTGGGSISNVKLYVQKDGGSWSLVGGMTAAPGNVFTASWGGAIANETAEYRFYATASIRSSGTTQSPVSAKVDVQAAP